MKGKSGYIICKKSRLFPIEPQLNDIKLKTIIMKFKFQNVNWLYLGVTNDILNYEKNVACITKNGSKKKYLNFNKSFIFYFQRLVIEYEIT